MEDYQSIVLAAGSAVALILAVSIIWTIVRRRRRERALHAPIPLIPFSAGAGVIGRPSRPEGLFTPPRTPAGVTPTDVSAWAPPTAASWSGVGSDATPASSTPVGAPSVGAAGRAVRSALADTAVASDDAPGAAVDGASVRYWRPADGTLQFLPGRLEVISGRDAGHEIRFVRTPGPDGTQVTFGRADGAPYRHVQLREPTVSRAHARMILESGGAQGMVRGAATPGGGSGARWRLENLSATNPVVVNGRALGTDGGASASVTLSEGDRIEMGEVVFRFHEK